MRSNLPTRPGTNFNTSVCTFINLLLVDGNLWLILWNISVIGVFYNCGKRHAFQWHVLTNTMLQGNENDNILKMHQTFHSLIFATNKLKRNIIIIVSRVKMNSTACVHKQLMHVFRRFCIKYFSFWYKVSRCVLIQDLPCRFTAA